MEKPGSIRTVSHYRSRHNACMENTNSGVVGKFSLGFSLMELLVAVSIIAILVSVAVTAYSTGQKKARDNRRKGDLKEVQNGFEQYYADNKGSYPATCSLTATYLPNGMPTDPKTGTAYTAVTGWSSCSTSSFCVCAGLEGETNAVTDCSGAAAPSGYTGMYCVKNAQ